MIASDVELGEDVVVFHPELVNLYGCKIGAESKIAAFVEIQSGAVLGRRVKVEAFVFIPTGVTIEDGGRRVVPAAPKNCWRISLSTPTTCQHSPASIRTQSDPMSPPEPVTRTFLLDDPILSIMDGLAGKERT